MLNILFALFKTFKLKHDSKYIIFEFPLAIKSFELEFDIAEKLALDILSIIKKQGKNEINNE